MLTTAHSGLQKQSPEAHVFLHWHLQLLGFQYKPFYMSKLIFIEPHLNTKLP